MGCAEESKGKWGGVPIASYIARVKVAFLRVTLLSSLLKHWYQRKHWEISLFEPIPLLIRITMEVLVSGYITSSF